MVVQQAPAGATSWIQVSQFDPELCASRMFMYGFSDFLPFPKNMMEDGLATLNCPGCVCVCVESHLIQ